MLLADKQIMINVWGLTKQNVKKEVNKEVTKAMW